MPRMNYPQWHEKTGTYNWTLLTRLFKMGNSQLVALFPSPVMSDYIEEVSQGNKRCVNGGGEAWKCLRFGPPTALLTCSPWGISSRVLGRSPAAGSLLSERRPLCPARPEGGRAEKLEVAVAARTAGENQTLPSPHTHLRIGNIWSVSNMPVTFDLS